MALNPGRPRIDIPRTRLDHALQVISALCVLGFSGFGVYVWPSVPAMVPRHFGFDGTPDAWGERGGMLVLPIVGLVMYVSLSVLERFPHIYNYPVAVTNQNARELYTLGRRWLSVTKTILTASLGFAFYATVQTARGELRGLSQWYLPVLLLTLSAVTGIVLVRMWRAKSS
jgi:uncharacterized membrane protein